MALALSSAFPSMVVNTPGPVGRAFAEQMPGVTAPFGLFVRRLARNARTPPRQSTRPAQTPCHTHTLSTHQQGSSSCRLPAYSQDPAGFLDDLSNDQITMYREAELAHCRVSMVAALGFLVQENFHPIFPEVGGPAARQLDIVLQSENGQAIMASLLFGVMLTEITRARIGWEDPDVEMQSLRPEYTPGDLGFDPLGMAPKDEAGMLAM